MKKYRTRDIPPFDLASFRKPEIANNRNFFWRSSWYILNAVFFQSSLFGLLPSRIKAELLRLFGAKIGKRLVCKPRVSIKYPWFLTLGDDVWLGEGVWIDNMSMVSVGSNVCISQGVYIGNGNHDWTDSAFKFFSRPIEIGDGVWVTAFLRIGSGTVIEDHVVVLGEN